MLIRSITFSHIRFYAMLFCLLENLLIYFVRPKNFIDQRPPTGIPTEFLINLYVLQVRRVEYAAIAIIASIVCANNKRMRVIYLFI